MCVVMVEHQTGTLLVGIVEGQDALRRVRSTVRHVRDVIDTHPSRIVRVLSCRSGPLVRCAVADPRGHPAMQVEGRSVLRIVEGPAWRHIHLKRTHARSHHGLVDRDEQIANPFCICGEVVDEPDTHWPVLVGDDQWAKVMEGVDCGIGGIGLPVTAKSGRREIRVKLFIELSQLDHVIVTTDEVDCGDHSP
ncbi:MAG: hypothetical protein BWY93_00404 [Euryarchaeota archaeon ADurb.BinA087]|nr:MAG: hypothetical protein BWY93_00404 [Euryarchaeota archaeon ADurb.BinA087]